MHWCLLRALLCTCGCFWLPTINTTFLLLLHINGFSARNVWQTRLEECRTIGTISAIRWNLQCRNWLSRNLCTHARASHERTHCFNWSSRIIAIYAANHFDCICINIIIISIYTSAYKRVRSHEFIIYACDIRTQNVLLPMQPGPARLPAKNERFMSLAQAARRSSWPPNLWPARSVSRVYLEIRAYTIRVLFCRQQIWNIYEQHAAYNNRSDESQK